MLYKACVIALLACSISRGSGSPLPRPIGRLRAGGARIAMAAIGTANQPEYSYVPYRMKEVVPREAISMVRFRQIVVGTRELADEIKAAVLTNQMQFGELAELISIDPSKESGGDVGFLYTKKENPDRGVPPEIINRCIYLNKGEIDVMKIRRNDMDTYHIIQLLDSVNDLELTAKKRRIDFLRRNRDKNLTYTIDTFGCQMNTADSEKMEGQLLELGYVKAVEGSENNAGVVIINTCSIRDHAEQKVFSYIGPHALRKRNGEDVTLIVSGCVAQQESEKLVKRFPEIDIVMGPQYSNRLSTLLESSYDGFQIVATEPSYLYEDTITSRRRSDVTAFVNVIYGCNERCTYCVVPNTRGVEQSRNVVDIVNEVKELVAAGYQEVTLLGQNIDSWGRDFTPKQKFADLLGHVAQVDGLKRLRFLTSHPKYMSKSVIETVKAHSDVVMPNFNVPFQSGSNVILSNMKRGYTRERYLEIIDTIRTAIPDASITADCIVGFPGETEEQFQETLSLMASVKFDMLNTAAYSPRPNTPAGEWTNQLDDQTKQDRLQRINRLASEHALERSQRFVGRVESVLVEEVNIKNVQQVIGRLPHNRLVYFNGDISQLKGRSVPVRIVSSRPYSLLGELVDDVKC